MLFRLEAIGRWLSVNGEWIMEQAAIPVEEYELFAKQFNPVKFDANSWVKLAKSAGMKYIVITSKHHDGFCMWDSKYTPNLSLSNLCYIYSL